MTEQIQRPILLNESGAIASSGTDSDTLNVPYQQAEKLDAKQELQGWDNAPDGGAAAWLCVLGAWCTSICSFGWINSSYSLHYFVIFDKMATNFGVSVQALVRFSNTIRPAHCISTLQAQYLGSHLYKFSS